MSALPAGGGGNTYQNISLGGSAKGHLGDSYTYYYGERKRRPPPAITCDKCSAKGIATELHYHCSKCEDGNFDICVRCYHNGRGCHHWNDFRDNRRRLYEREDDKKCKESAFKPRPPREGPAHTLSARKYTPTTTDAGIAGAEDWELQEGAFCDSCQKHCNGSFWHCRTCFGGGWSFCDTCVMQGKHCTHDLVPICHQQDRNNLAKARPVEKTPHLEHDSYQIVPIWIYCDTCNKEIEPTDPRYHCYQCSDGHFDMCQKCFHRMYRDLDMPRAFKRWRRCFKGHRMAVIKGEPVGNSLREQRLQARVTISPPLGGWRIVDDLRAIVKYDPDPETFEIGSTHTAIQSYFPSGTQESVSHLAFPIHAEITEVERIDDETAIGVYCGRIGRFPRWCIASKPSRMDEHDRS